MTTFASDSTLSPGSTATAPIASLCERAGWWVQATPDSWAVLANPATNRWQCWRRIDGDRTRARLLPGDYRGADEAVKAGRKS